MPALLPVAGVCRVVMRGTANGQAVVNVFHVRCGADAIAEANVDTILTNVRTAYQVNLVPRLNGTWSGDTATAVDLTSLVGSASAQPLGGTPGATSTNVPQSAACCVTWRIARHYRGGHPRTYLGPLNAGVIESPTSLTSAYVGLVQAGAEAFLSAVNGVTTPDGTCSLVAVHRYLNREELDPPQTSAITGATVDTRIDTMRRRLGPDR